MTLALADTQQKVCLNIYISMDQPRTSKLDEVEISKIYGHPIKFVDHQHNRECCEV